MADAYVQGVRGAVGVDMTGVTLPPLTYAQFRQLYPELTEQQAQQAYRENQSIPSYYTGRPQAQAAA
jgi:hypothetical protein